MWKEIVFVALVVCLSGHTQAELNNYTTLENSTSDTIITQPPGEVLQDFDILKNAPPNFERVKKPEEISSTSSKTETVDISPKLAINDEDVFWEVTKIPEEKTRDGNHPDTKSKITHSHIDELLTNGTQTKRVKKILPPFQTDKLKSKEETEIKNIKETNNIEKPILINKRNLVSTNLTKSLNQTKQNEKESKNSFKMFDSLSEDDNKTQVKHKKYTRKGKDVILMEMGKNGNNKDNDRRLEISFRKIKNKEEKKSLKLNSEEKLIKREEIVHDSGGDIATTSKSITPTLDSSQYFNDVLTSTFSTNSVEDASVPANKQTLRKQKDTLTTGRRTKEVDVAPDLSSLQTTPILDIDLNKEQINESPTTPTRMIVNPEFLNSLGTTEPESVTDEIKGIELVPQKTEHETGSPKITVEVTINNNTKDELPRVEPNIWNWLRDRKNPETFSTSTDKPHFDSFEEESYEKYPEPRALPYQSIKPNIEIKTTEKSIFSNFDMDSAEIEYETENFQHGYSNIEKHELPFSYAQPWLDIRDRTFDVSDEVPQVEIKKVEEKVRRKQVNYIHTKMNDFPRSLPISNHHFEAINTNEEMRIPQDLSNILKLSELSQSDERMRGVTVSVVDSGINAPESPSYGHRSSKWYLLLLTGNSTIVRLRKNDFTKYVKLNLAARLSVEYDDIRVNKIILAPPKVLVNISVFLPSDDVAEESQIDIRQKFDEKEESPLYKLAETNATLLELSGEEYHVVRFLSLHSTQPEAQAQRDNISGDMSQSARHDDIEFVIYTFLGSACACAIILTLFITMSKYFKKLSHVEWPWMKPKNKAWTFQSVRWNNRLIADEFNGVSPAVIYSGGFPQVRSSWMHGSKPGPAKTNYQPSLLQQYPGIEIGPIAKNPTLYPELQMKEVTSSPRHSRLQMYNCGVDNVVIPEPRPLDVRLGGQDNPNFAN